MTNEPLLSKDDYGRSEYRFSKLEHSVEFLDYKIKQETPLTIRISVIEERLTNEIEALKKDLSDTKSEAKFKMAERLVYVSIIVGLITTLITLKFIGKI